MDDVLGSAALAAFPAALAADVCLVAQVLPPTRLPPAGSVRVWVQGEHLAIPYRLYNPESADDVLGRLSLAQARILHCLYTRHHDGRVRQRHLSQILEAADPWIVPFVVQLTGECVLDIVLTISQALAGLGQPGTPRHQAYGQFAAANPGFLALTSQRAASYWDCYYRSRFPLRCYPGRIILDSLKDAAAHYPEPPPTALAQDS